MGGLVIKKVCSLISTRINSNSYADEALALASINSKFEDVKRSIAGVIFLGTPHDGTDLAGFATFIATVKQNDPSLVKSLMPEARELFEASRDFASGYSDLPVMCFFESAPTDYTKRFSRPLGRLLRIKVRIFSNSKLKR